MRRKEKETGVAIGKDQRQRAAAHVKAYLEENFDLEVSLFQAELFVDFFSDKAAAAYYNKGLADAQAFLSERLEDMCLLMKDEEDAR